MLLDFNTISVHLISLCLVVIVVYSLQLHEINNNVSETGKTAKNHFSSQIQNILVKTTHLWNEVAGEARTNLRIIRQIFTNSIQHHFCLPAAARPKESLG